MHVMWEQLPWLTPVLYIGLAACFVLAIFRVIIGPGLPDRVVALDLALAIVLCFSAVYAGATGKQHFLDVALAIAVIAFIATIALARFIEKGVRRDP